MVSSSIWLLSYLNMGERECLYLALSELSCLGFRAGSHICNPLITNRCAQKAWSASSRAWNLRRKHQPILCRSSSGESVWRRNSSILHRILGCLLLKYIRNLGIRYIWLQYIWLSLYMQRLSDSSMNSTLGWVGHFLQTFVSFLHGFCSTLRKRGQERTFFNLVLVKTASSGSSQTSRDTLRQLPPLEGPKVLPDAGKKGKGKAKGKGKIKKGKGQKQKGHSVGHWILLHHTPKILVKPDCKSSLLWWHPTEHAIWSRGWRGRLKNRKEEDEQWQAFSNIFLLFFHVFKV